jgi:hypothetical protein
MTKRRVRPKDPAAVALGRKGGQSRSPAKVAAARANGRKARQPRTLNLVGGPMDGSGLIFWALTEMTRKLLPTSCLIYEAHRIPKFFAVSSGVPGTLLGRYTFHEGRYLWKAGPLSATLWKDPWTCAFTYPTEKP